MGKRITLAVGLLFLVMLPGIALLLGQPVGQPAQGGGPGFGPQGPMGPPPPPIAMTVANGVVVYVASGGQLTAFEAATLKKLAEVTLPQPKGRPGNGKAGEAEGAPAPPEGQGAGGAAGGPGGMMGPPMPPPHVTLAVSDNYVFVVLGPTMYQFDAKSLKELNHVELKMEKPPLGPGGMGEQ